YMLVERGGVVHVSLVSLRQPLALLCHVPAPAISLADPTAYRIVRLIDDVEPPRAGRADHHAARRVEVVGVEVDHLLLGDLADLRHRHPADRAALAGGLGALLDPGRLL